MMHTKRDPNGPNPQKGQVGIVERIKTAKTQKERDKLLKEARGYESISKATMRRAQRASHPAEKKGGGKSEKRGGGRGEKG